MLNQHHPTKRKKQFIWNIDTTKSIGETFRHKKSSGLCRVPVSQHIPLILCLCNPHPWFFLAPGSKYDILINGILWFQKAVSIPYSNGLSVWTSQYMKVKHLSHWIPMEWMFSNGLMFWMFLWGFNPTSGWIISYIPSNISNNLYQQIPSHMRTMVLVYLPTWLGDF